VVVGKSGEEIWTDKYGRVKLKFHWDRSDARDENSSCWIRVSQHWAGKNWGAIQIPRIGQEVIVEFEEGDPDRPIVTGRVYNADQMPPYTLPDNQTQSGVLTRSTKQGNTKTFNELRFEDKKDSELIYFHAEKNFERIVENNDTLKVGMEKKDKGDQIIEIWNDRTETVHEGKETITIKKGDRLVTIEKGKETLDVQTGDRQVTVAKGNDTHDIKVGNRVVNIDTGNDDLTIKTGNHTVKISLGKSSTEAMQSIELKVGASSIKIEPSKITLNSVQIEVNGNAQTDVKGTLVNVQGSATTTIKGGIVQVN
jgi:type VI secretion system secreted protein VgrG